MEDTHPVFFNNQNFGLYSPLFILAISAILITVFDCNDLAAFGYSSPEFGALVSLLIGYLLANICHELFPWNKKVMSQLWNVSWSHLLCYLFSWNLTWMCLCAVSILLCKNHISVAFVVPAFIMTFAYRFKFSLHRVEVLALREFWKLSPGYWAANSYYHNYLKLFLIEFMERVDKFNNQQGINTIKKLFVLVPKSCKVERFLDTSQRIERARELCSFTRNIAGTKDREYNITVYQVFKNLETYDSYRCCVEYAQPLRQLWDLRHKEYLTDNEMHQERTIFVQTLYKLLKDENDSHKVCELLCYDDNSFDVIDVLLQACDESSD